MANYSNIYILTVPANSTLHGILPSHMHTLDIINNTMFAQGRRAILKEIFDLAHERIYWEKFLYFLLVIF